MTDSSDTKFSYAHQLLYRIETILKDVFEQAGKRYAQQHGITLD
jgi:hypothetical protein